MFACEIGHFRKDTAGFLPDSPKVKQCEDMSAVVAEDGSIGSLTFVSLNSRLESNKAEEEKFRGAGVPGTMTAPSGHEDAWAPRPNLGYG